MAPSFRRTLRHFTFVLHEPGAKRALGSVLVVGSAAEPDRRNSGPAAARKFLNMIELDELASLAAVPGLAYERALAAVTFPDRTPDLGRDVARALARTTAPARLRSRRELAALEFLDQGIQRKVDHLSRITRRKLVPEQVLGVLQLLPRASSDHQLQRKTLTRHRRNLRARANWPRGQFNCERSGHTGNVVSRWYPPRGG